MSLYTPAARQPRFACPQCPRRVFDRAALKNHIRTIHVSTYSVGQTQPPPTNEQISSRRSSDVDEELIPPVSPTGIPDIASPASTLRVQPSLFDNFDDYNDNDRDYGSHDENNITGSELTSRSSTPILLPSSQSHEPRMRTLQRKPADDKFLRKIYHSTLNGEAILMF